MIDWSQMKTADMLAAEKQAAAQKARRAEIVRRLQATDHWELPSYAARHTAAQMKAKMAERAALHAELDRMKIHDN